MNVIHIFVTVTPWCGPKTGLSLSVYYSNDFLNAIVLKRKWTFILKYYLRSSMYHYKCVHQKAMGNSVHVPLHSANGACYVWISKNFLI